MKKLIMLAALALSLASCKKIDPIETLNEYSNCLTVAFDTVSGTEWVADFASIKVKGDATTGNFILDFDDFQLHQGEPLQSATLSNLPQFFSDKVDDQGQIIGANYYFFKYQESTRISGTLPVSDFRMGWLSSVYWLTLTSGPCKVWSIPRRYDLYAVRNEVRGPFGNNFEQAIYPKYAMRLNPSDATVAIAATFPTFPVDSSDPSKTVRFRTLDFGSLPVEFTSSGYTARAAELPGPFTDDNDDQWRIINLSASIAADFDQGKQLAFTLERLSDSMRLRIIVTLAYTYPKE